MKKKKHIGQLVSLKFTDRKTRIYGYVIDYNDDWALLKNNPGDYIIDGYMILRNKNLGVFCREAEEKWREKVINLKGLQPTAKEIIPLTDLETILKYLTDNFGVFQIHTKSESLCYLGRLNAIDDKVLVMDNLSPKGKWDGQMKFRTLDIRTIEFDTDYVNSLKLVSTSQKSI